MLERSLEGLKAPGVPEVKTRSEPLIGLDLIKLLSFSAISIFHAALLYFYSPDLPFREISPIFRGLEIYARSLSFSGFTIVLLSSLLLAFSGKLNAARAQLFAILGIGATLLSICMNNGGLLVWDVYSLFFFGLVIFILAGRAARVLGLVGFFLLWIPFWKFDFLRPYLGLDAQHIFGLAPCVGREISEWPLLPWIGLIWFGAWLGSELRQLKKQSPEKLELSWAEGGLWLLFIGLSLPQWGAFYRIGIGPLFSCDAYRQEPSVFWSHMVPVLFAIRLSFDRRVQSFLRRQAWSRSLERLMIVRHFWLAYIVQYVYISIWVLGLLALKEAFPEIYLPIELPLLEFLALTMFIQFELVSRGIYAGAQKIWRKRRRRSGSEATPATVHERDRAAELPSS